MSLGITKWLFKLSIRQKLTIGITASILLALMALSLGVYGYFSYTLYQEVDQNIYQKGQEVVKGIRIERYPFQPLGEVVLPDVDILSAPDVFLQILDAEGSIVSKSNNLGHQKLPLSRNTLLYAVKGEDFYETVTVRGKEIRTFNSPIIVNQKPIALLQVGRSLDNLNASLSRLRWYLIAGNSLTALLAGYLAWLTAGKGLAGINALVRQVMAIQNGDDLSKRVSQPEATDEVSLLAGAVNNMLGRLQRAYAEVMGLNVRQQQFVADASHELRTPLTTIKGNLGFLLKHADVDQATRNETLVEIDQEVDRMHHLVEALLNLARLDSTEQAYLEPTELKALVEWAVAQVKIWQPEAQVELSLPSEAWILGNQAQLKQVLLVLLDNAIKYSPKPARLEFSLQVTEQVLIRLRDYGVGMSGEEVAQAFERFYRGDKARGVGGTGLGLSIAKGIIEQHQGQIELNSSLGEGTEVVIGLPIYRAIEGSNSGGTS